MARSTFEDTAFTLEDIFIRTFSLNTLMPLFFISFSLASAYAMLLAKFGATDLPSCCKHLSRAKAASAAKA